MASQLESGNFVGGGFGYHQKPRSLPGLHSPLIPHLRPVTTPVDLASEMHLLCISVCSPLHCPAAAFVQPLSISKASVLYLASFPTVYVIL